MADARLLGARKLSSLRRIWPKRESLGADSGQALFLGTFTAGTGPAIRVVRGQKTVWKNWASE